MFLDIVCQHCKKKFGLTDPRKRPICPHCGTHVPIVEDLKMLEEFRASLKKKKEKKS